MKALAFLAAVAALAHPAKIYAYVCQGPTQVQSIVTTHQITEIERTNGVWEDQTMYTVFESLKPQNCATLDAFDGVPPYTLYVTISWSKPTLNIK
jgi:hypothetical protein